MSQGFDQHFLQMIAKIFFTFSVNRKYFMSNFGNTRKYLNMKVTVEKDGSLN